MMIWIDAGPKCIATDDLSKTLDDLITVWDEKIQKAPAAPITVERIVMRDKYKELRGLLSHGGWINTFEKDEDVEIIKYIGCALGGLKSQCGAIVFDNWQIDDPTEEMWDKHLIKMEKLGRGFGYTKMLVTHVKGAYVIESLMDRGFKVIDEFTNRRSGNVVQFLTKEIPIHG